MCLRCDKMMVEVKEQSPVQSGAVQTYIRRLSAGQESKPLAFQPSGGSGAQQQVVETLSQTLPMPRRQQSTAANQQSGTDTGTAVKQPRPSPEQIEAAKKLLKFVKPLIDELNPHFDLAEEEIQVGGLENSLNTDAKAAVQTLTSLKSELSGLINEHNTYIAHQSKSNKLLADLKNKLSTSDHNALIDEFNTVNENKTKTKATAAEKLYNKLQTLTNSQTESPVQQSPPQQPVKPTVTPQQPDKPQPQQPTTTTTSSPSLGVAQDKPTVAQQFKSLQADVVKLGQDLANRTPRVVTTFYINAKSKEAVDTYNQNNAQGLKALQELWDFLQKKKEAADGVSPQTNGPTTSQNTAGQSVAQPQSQQQAAQHGAQTGANPQPTATPQQPSQQSVKPTVQPTAKPQPTETNLPDVTLQDPRKASGQADQSRLQQEQEAAKKKAEEEKAAQEAERQREAERRLTEARGKIDLILQEVEKLLPTAAPFVNLRDDLTGLRSTLQQAKLGTDLQALGLADADGRKRYEEIDKTLQIRLALAAERAQALQKYTSAGAVQQALANTPGDTKAVTDVQAVLQKETNALEALRNDETKPGSEITAAIQRINLALPKVTQARQFAQARAQALSGYTTAGQVQQTLGNVAGDNQTVANAKAELQKEASALEALRDDETKPASEITAAIQRINLALPKVTQARQFAQARAQALSGYITAGQVQQALGNVAGDNQTVANAKGDLQKEVNALEALKQDETKAGSEITAAIQRINQALPKVTQARQFAQARANALAAYTTTGQVQQALGNVAGDNQTVANAKADLQKEVNALEALKQDETKAGSEITAAIQRINQALPKVTQARLFAQARANALAAYNAAAVNQALAQMPGDDQAVANAKADLQKELSALEALKKDETKAGSEITTAIQRIGQALKKVQSAREAAKKKAAEESTTKPKTASEPSTEDKIKKLSLSAKEQEVLKALNSRPNVAKGATSTLEDISGLIYDVEKNAAEAEPKITKAQQEIKEAAERVNKEAATVKAENEKLNAAQTILNEADGKEYNHTNNAISNLLDEFNKVFGKPPDQKPAQHVVGKMRAAFDTAKQRRATALDLWNKKNDYSGAVRVLSDTLNELRQIHQATATVAEQQAGWQDLQKALTNKAQAGEDKLKAENALQGANARLAEAEKAKKDAEQAKKDAEQAKKDAEQAAAPATAKAQQLKTRLLQAAQFGALSKPQDAKGEKAQSDILKHFKDHPETALEALDIAQKSEHPDVVAKGVPVAGRLAEAGFPHLSDNGTTTVSFSAPSTRRDMARNALELGGCLGGDYFERMEEYYKSPPKKEEFHFVDSQNFLQLDKKAVHYTQAIAGKAIKNGTVNFNAPEVRSHLDNLHFHPNNLINPQPALASQIQDIRDKFATDGKYQQELNKVKPPNSQNGASAKLVRDTVGLQPSQGVSSDAAKGAVLACLMTPFAQGSVGSCFATGPCLEEFEKNPLKVMADLTKIIETGVLQRDNMPPCAAVTKVPAGQISLLRSWEYTIATAGHREDAAQKMETVENGVFRPPDGGLCQLGSSNEAQFKDVIAESFKVVYDPNITIANSSDQTSETGAFVLKCVVPGREQTFTGNANLRNAAFKAKLIEVLGARFPTGQSQINSAINSVEQWIKTPEPETGGQPKGAKDLLTATTHTQTDLDLNSHAHPQCPNNKSVALLDSMLSELPNDPEAYTTLRAVGKHTMNALPKHPTFQALKQNGSAQQNIKDKLLDPAESIAATPLETDRARYLYNKALDSLVSNAGNLAAAKNVSPGPLKPKDLRQFILNNGSGLTEAQVDSFLLQELNPPQVVLADTNWGSARDHELLVLAPDPKSPTGDLIMWTKNKFSGAYKRETRFTNSPWAVLKPQ